MNKQLMLLVLLFPIIGFCQKYNCELFRIDNTNLVKTTMHKLNMEDEFIAAYNDGYEVTVALEEEEEKTFAFIIEIEKNGVKLLYTGTGGLKINVDKFDSYVEIRNKLSWKCECEIIN